MDKHNNILELFLNDEVQKLLDNFAGLLDLRVTFYSRFGMPIRRGKAMPNTDFCNFIQNDLDLLESCQHIDQLMRDKVTESCTPIAYTCHAGLREIIAPVIIGGRLAGFLMAGQFRTTDTVPSCALAVCRNHAEREKMQQSFAALPKLSNERQEAIIGALQMLIDYIAARELAVFRPDPLKSMIDKYIDEHYKEDVYLKDVAAALNKSISSVAQFLRNKYHTCFKDLLIERKLCAAEEYWKLHPQASIRECAEAAGFKDQFYFSRIFRKKRDLSPRQFRAKWSNL
ncbi:MAG: helix-turn-helix domain-containing protein [Lentisphaerae bacterium]|nr:helix-turn-helix domain-containing protein [Lentisphaerota bacterium]